MWRGGAQGDGGRAAPPAGWDGRERAARHARRLPSAPLHTAGAAARGEDRGTGRGPGTGKGLRARAGGWWQRGPLCRGLASPGLGLRLLPVPAGMRKGSVPEDNGALWAQPAELSPAHPGSPGMGGTRVLVVECGTGGVAAWRVLWVGGHPRGVGPVSPSVVLSSPSPREPRGGGWLLWGGWCGALKPEAGAEPGQPPRPRVGAQKSGAGGTGVSRPRPRGGVGWGCPADEPPAAAAAGASPRRDGDATEPDGAALPRRGGENGTGSGTGSRGHRGWGVGGGGRAKGCPRVGVPVRASQRRAPGRQ